VTEQELVEALRDAIHRQQAATIACDEAYSAHSRASQALQDAWNAVSHARDALEKQLSGDAAIDSVTLSK